MGSFFSGDAPQVAAPDYTEMTPLKNRLFEQMNNNSGMGSPTPGQEQFKYMGGQSLENTLQGQSAQRGIRASQLASMGNNALSQQQSQLAGQSALRDAAERDMASNQLANMLLTQQGQISQVNAANQQAEMQKQAGQDRLIGMGLSAGGYALGGPGGYFATKAATDGMGQTPTYSGGRNAYSQANMAQGLQFKGGY